jgi:hypothetical protein
VIEENMTDQEIQKLIQGSMVDLGTEVGARLVSGGDLTSAAFTATLESQARDAAVNALLVWIKLRLLARVTAEMAH